MRKPNLSLLDGATLVGITELDFSLFITGASKYPSLLVETPHVESGFGINRKMRFRAYSDPYVTKASARAHNSASGPKEAISTSGIAVGS
jgi:hypothetical protein